MKKIILPLFLLCILTAGAFGQTDGMLNINEYSKLFLNPAGIMSRNYTRVASDEDYNRIAALGGSVPSVDTPLEIALLSICAGVADVRPAEANRMLGNAKQADQKLGAAVFQEIQILRFLADTAAVNRHEAVLKFITDRGNATRAEIETYYRNGIRGLVSAVVDEEFNKVSFLLEKSRTVSYNAVLIRNPQNGQYILTYEGVDVNYKIINYAPITTVSLEALLTEMRRNTTDFSQTSIDTVRAQAALIPAVVYAEWKAKGLGDGMALIKETLTNFYLNPTMDTYNIVRGIYSRYYAMATVLNDRFADIAGSSYARALGGLDLGLNRKIVSENKSEMQSALNRDDRYKIFSTQYGK